MKKPVSLRGHRPKDIICKKCELARLGRWNCMPGFGNPRAKIMIVGDSPDPSDDEKGRPFTGLYGTKIMWLLEEAGVHRNDVWFTQAVKCKPPRGKQPVKRNWKACAPHLAQEIQYVQPKVIIAMGSAAVNQILPDIGGLGGARGFPVPKRDADGSTKYWILPTYSPKYSLAQPQQDAIVIRDLKVANSIAKGTYKPKPLDFQVKVCTSIDAVEKAVAEIEEYEEWAFDVETGDLNYKKFPITCFGFGLTDKYSIVVPYEKTFTRQGEVTTWTELEKKHVHGLMNRLLQNDADKYAHNGKFDKNFCKEYGLRLRKFVFDTMAAHHLIDVNKPHDLLFLAQWFKLVDEQYDAALEAQFRAMGKRDYMNVDSSTLFHYCGIDCSITLVLKFIFEDLLKKYGVEKVFRTISMPLAAHVLHDMEFQGARLDVKKLLKMSRQAGDRLIELQGAVDRASKGAIKNPRSNKQVLAHLKEKKVIRMPSITDLPGTGPKLTKSGNLSLDDEVLTKLEKRVRAGDVPGLIKETRKWTKLKGTYLDGKDGRGGMMGKLDENHRLHTTFKVHGTITGRLSSADPNLQNIPRDSEMEVQGKTVPISVRGLFIPDAPGDEFMSVDYAQLEVRVAAALSKDPVMIKEILQGVDMHSRNAATVLMKITEKAFLEVYKNEDHPDFKLYKEKRSTAKAVTFGVLYGSQAAGVARRNDLPVEEAERFIVGFFRKYKKLTEWIEKTQKDAIYRGLIKTETGRIIRFPSLKWAKSRYCPRREKFIRRGEVERVAVNAPIQSYGSDIFQSRKIALWKAMKKERMKSRLVLTIHDGFIANVKPDEKEEVRAMAEEIMPWVLNKGTKFEVPLPVDIEWSDRWGFDEDDEPIKL